MSLSENFEERARALAASPSVRVLRPPTPMPMPTSMEPAFPPDLAALYAVCDGLELDDGTVIMSHDAIAEATTWLKEQRELYWSDELMVIGERDDLVIVRDADIQARRSGGGVLEAPTDGLESFRRVSLDVIAYLEERVGIGKVGIDIDLDLEGARSPERLSLEAMEARDASALARALARGFYPGAEREFARAAMTLGSLRAEQRDAVGAMEAFCLAVESRARAVPRGAEEGERRAAWRACAIACEKVGATEMSLACKARAAAVEVG